MKKLGLETLGAGLVLALGLLVAGSPASAGSADKEGSPIEGSDGTVIAWDCQDYCITDGLGKSDYCCTTSGGDGGLTVD